MALLVRERSVIATGGGIVETPGNCVAMEAAGRIVWLSAPTEVLLARLECDPQERPLLATGGAQRLAGLARDRNPLYARIARHRVDTQGLDEYRVAEIVAGLMAEQPENRQ